ncbi:MAG: hypothetical protein LUI09_08690 [Prevotellaceae bacterium]|nr:hypothetical protein [Prevotellaceae bacterium]
MKTKKREAIVSALRELGLRPTVDEEGDVRFTYEMKTLYALAGDEEEPYVVLLLPQFHTVGEEELSACLVASNKLTRELRLAKVFVDEQMRHVSALCDFLYHDEATLKEALRRSARALAVVGSLFRRTMLELGE